MTTTITVHRLSNGKHLAVANRLCCAGNDVPSAIGNLILRYTTALDLNVVLDNREPEDREPETMRSKVL